VKTRFASFSDLQSILPPIVGQQAGRRIRPRRAGIDSPMAFRDGGKFEEFGELFIAV
jgi:hypothetical protein